MRNFIITIDGKQYEVGVEEVGAAQSPAPAAKAAPAVQSASVSARRIFFIVQPSYFCWLLLSCLVKSSTASTFAETPILMVRP